MVIYFLYGLSFFILGLAALLRLRQGGELPLSKQLPWLAAFGFAVAATGWIDMLSTGGGIDKNNIIVKVFILISHPLSGILLLRFGWGIFKDLLALPPWMIFVPGVLIVPIAYVITYAATTFITPSPIEIPIDIWSRYLLYLPGSVLAGIGFLRQWYYQNKLGYKQVSSLMFAAGVAFLFEALVVGFIVPAAPYGPASYYNYDRVVYNAFIGEQLGLLEPFGVNYERVIELTGLSIDFWRMISAFAVTFFIIRGLDVFDEIQKMRVLSLQSERDLAQKTALETQISARETAEMWTDALVNINRKIANLEHVDDILLNLADNVRVLLDADFLGIALLEEDQISLNLKCYSTRDDVSIINTPMPVESALVLNVAHNARSYYSKKEEHDAYLEDTCFFTEGTPQSIASVYLNLDNRSIGAMWVVRFSGRYYSEEDLIWLECMADQVVIALQHGLMTAQLQSYSVTEERARIAREMHDGLAQVLGYLNLQVQTIEALYTSGKEDMLEKELKHMRSAIKSAHADVRENILSLRTTLAHKEGLLSAVEEYLQEFGIQTGVNTKIRIDNNKNLNLSSIAEVQLVCILQEALANVRKHAEAESVELIITKELSLDEEFVQMQIIDDGKGFLREESNRSFGLQTMQERASSINGQLQIKSVIGAGTEITCKIPCLETDKYPV